MNSSRLVISQPTHLSVAEFLALGPVEMASLSVLEATSLPEATSVPLLVVDLIDDDRGEDNRRDQPAVMPVCPVVGLRRAGSEVAGEKAPEFVDLVVRSEEQLQTVIDVVSAHPHAAALLVQLLRNTDGASVPQGLFAESLTYSTLQHSAEFERWLNERANVANASSNTRADSIAEPAVLVSREANRLAVQLNRPERRNAFSAEIRDQLCEALELACLDDSIEHIMLSGAGTAFCAGGDLMEFGQARDAGRAHLSRTTRSAGALIHQLRDRVRVQVQGACIGAGIELPAFAGQIQAHPKSFFQLPEITLGLVPGAGGCISLPRRIGRHRTAFMALSAARITAPQALAWGLIDNIGAA